VTPANSLNFTKSELTKIAPPATGRIEYRDTKVAGLQLRVSSTGVKTFSVYRWGKATNKPERVTIGRFPEISVDAARAKAGEIVAAFAMGENPSEAKRKARAEMTFVDLFDLYIERHSKVHKRTWREDQSKYQQYLCSEKEGINLAAKKLSAIDRTDIARLHAKIGKAHPITANRVIALVSSVFGRAITWDIYDKINPATKIKKFRENSRDRFLQRDELPRFFNALNEEPNDVIRRFFLVSLLTGARRGNVLAMRWDCLDGKNWTWKIPGLQSKNGVPLTVMLSAEVVELLNECKDGNDTPWVFPGTGKGGHLADPKKAWKRMLDTDELSQLIQCIRQNDREFITKEGDTLDTALLRAREQAKKYEIDTTGTRLADLRPHDLRRTLGSYQAMTGASLPIIGKSLGHKSQAATQVYARLDWDPVRLSVSRATQAMLEAGGIQTAEREAR
jgi:integrase